VKAGNQMGTKKQKKPKLKAFFSYQKKMESKDTITEVFKKIIKLALDKTR
jgi:hypothetical protein